MQLIPARSWRPRPSRTEIRRDKRRSGQRRVSLARSSGKGRKRAETRASGPGLRSHNNAANKPKLSAGERLDRTQEAAGSSPASSIRRRPCIRTALSPRASRIPARVAEDLQALVPLFGVIAADAGRSRRVWSDRASLTADCIADGHSQAAGSSGCAVGPFPGIALRSMDAGRHVSGVLLSWGSSTLSGAGSVMPRVSKPRERGNGNVRRARQECGP